MAYKAPPRRVSYVVPFPTGPPPPRLRLPSDGQSRHPDRHGDARPLIIRDASPPIGIPPSEEDDGHPRHCLGVNALALDTTTVLAGPSSAPDGSPSDGKRKRTPEGILYTGGRDGLIASWELGLSTRRRKRRYGVYGSERENRGRQGPLSRSDDDSDDEDDDDWDLDEEEEEEAVGLLDGAEGRPDHLRQRSYDQEGIPFEERWEVAGPSSVRRAILPFRRALAYQEQTKATFRQCVQSHTDWCNAMLLCNYNQTVISASSDRTLKAWSPHLHDKSMIPVTLGTHTDYVRCLAHGRDTPWVASAGLDKHIKLWNIAESRKTPLAAFPEDGTRTSIYSLATDPSGSLLASGSPERVVRLWDPRSASKISKLVGHTDNVRSLLISEDARFLLSASSDATVKLWSVGMQRCIHTFSYPSAAVWSLWSRHPSLEIFYSGDRAGYVCKVDLEACGDPSEGECVVLCKVDRADGTDEHCGDEAINSIVGADDSFIWTATGSSAVSKWKDVEPRWVRKTIIDGASASNGDEASPPLSPRPIPPMVHRPSSPADRPSPLLLAERFGGPSLTRTVSGASVAFADQPTVLPFRPAGLQPRLPSTLSTVTTHDPSGVDGLRDQRDGIPLGSLVPLESPDDLMTGNGLTALGRHHRDPESGMLYSSASIHSVHSLARVTSNVSPPSRLSYAIRGPRSLDGPSDTPRRPLSPGPDAAPQPAAWSLYQLRESAAEAVPFRDGPEEVIRGRAGLLRCEVLNDRRHVVSLDTGGSLALWDIITGSCLGTYSALALTATRRPSTVTASSSSGGTSSEWGPRQMLDALRHRIEGTASVMPWCTVETRTGQLTIHMEEGRCFEGEVYADEADLTPELLTEMRDDHRISLGRWVLRNLFEGFVCQQLHRRHVEAAEPRPSDQSFSRARPPHIKIPLPRTRSAIRRSASGVPRTPGMTISIATPAATPALPPDLKALRKGVDLTPIAGSPAVPPSTNQTPFATKRSVPSDYFSLKAAEEAAKPNGAGGEANGSRADKGTPASETTAGEVASPTPVGFLNRFRAFGRGGKRVSDRIAVEDAAGPPSPRASTEDEAPSEVVDPLAGLTPAQRLQHEVVEVILARPIEPCGPVEAPPLSLPPDMSIMISEESHDSGTWEVTYRGLVSTTEDDLEMLESVVPGWLLDFLLGNRLVFKEAPKVAFLLEPDGGAQAAGLSALPNGNARLTASRILRMRKVCVYVAQKLDLDLANAPLHHSPDPGRSRQGSIVSGTSTPRRPSGAGAGPSRPSDQGPDETKRAEDEIELVCNGQVVPWTMSLGAVRQYVWAKSSDVVISYRTPRR